MSTIEGKRAYARHWYHTHKDQHRANQKRYQKSHKDQLRIKLAPKKRDRNLKSNYGISSEDYEQMVVKQNGICAICGQLPIARLHVDHNHRTKQIRGLLCNNCNRGLGLYGDSIEILTKAIQYLSKHG